MKFLTLFLLCVILCSCKNSLLTVNTTDIDVRETTPAYDTDDITKNEEIKKIPLISEEEITALIDTYFLYEQHKFSEGLSSDYNDYVIDNSQQPFNKYYKVIDKNYDTWEEWTAFLESFYCGQLLEEALGYSTLGSGGSIINIDGFTYTNTIGGLGPMPHRYTYTLHETESGKTVAKVIQKDLFNDYFYVNEFVCTLTENGWRFQERRVYTTYLDE